MTSNRDWVELISPRYRQGFLSLLTEFSKYHELKFVIIGAVPLLIQGILDHYAFWDLDLIFRDEDHVREFTDLTKGKYLNLNDSPMIGRSILSYKTAWKRGGVWINVDLIIKGLMYYDLFSKNAKVFKATIEYKKEDYNIFISLADPIEILVDKLTSPRLIRDLGQENSLGVDLRHIIYILRAYQDDELFYSRIRDGCRMLSKCQISIENLKRIVNKKESFGYADFQPSTKLLSFIKK